MIKAPRSLPPVLLALALGRRVSRKSACKDRSSLGSISRFVSARQLDLVYDRDRSEKINNVILDKPRRKISRRDACDEMGLPRLKRFLHMDAHRVPATKQNNVAYVDTNSYQRAERHRLL